MASTNDALDELLKLGGAMTVALIDADNGMLLGKVGGAINLDGAAADNAALASAKIKAIKALGLDGNIEDILITLGAQYHLLRPLLSQPGSFVYLVLDRSKANLAMARLKLMDIERQMTF